LLDQEPFMPSPFPGIDPYLEAQGFWPDFHASFITYWRDALAELLPDNYEARMDERVNLVDLPADKIKRIEPDLAVSQLRRSSGPTPATSALATLEPTTIPLLVEEERRETYIEILRRPNRTLVAVLELLSPSNKEEPGRSSYLAKRQALLHEAVHLVELDFLLVGQHPPLARDYPTGHYFALVARADQRPDCEVYAWTIRQAVPAIPIPLHHPDPDVWINLAEVFTLTYDRGRYTRSIDYATAPQLPLSGVDATWVQQVAEGADSPGQE
jgi:hypothetical protein